MIYFGHSFASVISSSRLAGAGEEDAFKPGFPAPPVSWARRSPAHNAGPARRNSWAPPVLSGHGSHRCGISLSSRPSSREGGSPIPGRSSPRVHLGFLVAGAKRTVRSTSGEAIERLSRIGHSYRRAPFPRIRPRDCFYRPTPLAPLRTSPHGAFPSPLYRTNLPVACGRHTGSSTLAHEAACNVID